MKKLIATVLALMMMLSLLSACGGGTKEPTPAEEPAADAVERAAEDVLADDGYDTAFGLKPLEEKTTLRLAYFSGSEHAVQFYIMDEMGWAEELGLAFEWNYYSAGPAMMEASASWDVGTSGSGGSVIAAVGYPAVEIIGLVDYEHLFDVFVREDGEIYSAGTGNAANGNDTIYGSTESLRGSTWLLPMGTTAEWTLGLYLRQFDLTLDDVNVVNMDVGSALAGFRAGEGDGMVLWYSVNATAREEGYPIAATCDALEGVNATFMYATDEGIANKLDALATLYALYYRTCEWCMNNREEMAAMFYDACEVEGVACTEYVADITAEVFDAFTLEDIIDHMTVYDQDDPAGIEERAFSGAERDFFVTLDNFVSMGKYTDKDRALCVEEYRVNPTVAEAAKALLG